MSRECTAAGTRYVVLIVGWVVESSSDFVLIVLLLAHASVIGIDIALPTRRVLLLPPAFPIRHDWRHVVVLLSMPPNPIGRTAKFYLRIPF